MKRKRACLENYIDAPPDGECRIPSWKKRRLGTLVIRLRPLKRKKDDTDYIYDSVEIIPTRKRRRIMTKNECCKIIDRYHCYLHDNDISICQIYDCCGISYEQYMKMKASQTEYSYLL